MQPVIYVCVKLANCQFVYERYAGDFSMFNIGCRYGKQYCINEYLPTYIKNEHTQLFVSPFETYNS